LARLGHHADVDDGWLSVEQAADRCGMAYRTMLAKVRRSELPAEKPDGKPYPLRRADVEAFIERSRVKRGDLQSAPRRPPTN